MGEPADFVLVGRRDGNEYVLFAIEQPAVAIRHETAGGEDAELGPFTTTTPERIVASIVSAKGSGLILTLGNSYADALRVILGEWAKVDTEGTNTEVRERIATLLTPVP